MKKTLSIVAVASAMLALGSVANAEEYLETTGARNAAPVASQILLQERAPVQATRRHYNQAPAAQHNSAPQTDTNPGLGG